MNEHKLFCLRLPKIGLRRSLWETAVWVQCFLEIPLKKKIQLSEESIWNGDKIKTDGTDFKEKTRKLREMYLQGETVFDDWAKENITKGIYRIKSNEYAGVLT